MKNLRLSLPTYEFHIAKKIREKYDFDESLFSLTGNVVFANFYQVRVFTQKYNTGKASENQITAGEVNAAGLLDEIYHLIIKNYFKLLAPQAFPKAISFLSEKLSPENFEKLLLEFIELFPPQAVYKNLQTPKEYLNDTSEGVSNKQILLEELILLNLSNKNPALQKLKELFDENYFLDKQLYSGTIKNVQSYFMQEEFRIGKNKTDLFEFLSRPFQMYSGNLWDQLEFIKSEWGIYFDETIFRKLESSKDLFRESANFDANFGGGGGAPTIVPNYKGKQFGSENLVLGKSLYKYAEDINLEYDEPEQFTPDVNWMPNLVLMAKNIYVWLDQLSKKYKREIKTLDQIPLEELKLLKSWNINGLWLIGIWERSNASKRIKHKMGNIDAVASAYSLYDYEIAHDLGGEQAYKVFNENAKKAGVRLASDMVPNHTGIYSKWVIEHPEYFIQLEHPPFPNYSFTGENLSEQHDVEIRIEDQYWEMKDAAVVFERKDLTNGVTTYIYHGNDGTNMPWNDTAQLNMLKSEVREAVIQKIFDVARKFSVIRFDAAMTLAKKHFSRLWYPQPGLGGDIPSRADHALTRSQFDELFPKEFWREVVDRINAEMPETLLLAEAFWLMEGYFVRTLGMHRVYNSAFMHMMMNEENSKYRELITNTLEFEPEILKRYVNFMSNPDEETAINQFGVDDKYFGVLLLMITLPGLPMFAHGQIEGYTEKYGMEYKRAYYDEYPKQWLVDKHVNEIFPVLNKRYIFSDVKKFWLYDFVDIHNNLNENVFAYSNEANGEKALILFNNKFESASGKIKFSRQKLNGNSSSSQHLSNMQIAEALNIQNSDFHFYIIRDITNGLEYFYNGKDLHNDGIFVNLNGYEYRAYMYFDELFDTSGELYKYYKHNYGKGIYNIRYDLQKTKLYESHEAFYQLGTEEVIAKYLKFIDTIKYSKSKLQDYLDEIDKLQGKLISELSKVIKVDKMSKPLISLNLKNDIKTVHLLVDELSNSKTKSDKDLAKTIKKISSDQIIVFYFYRILEDLDKQIINSNEKDEVISKLLLFEPLENILKNNLSHPEFNYTKILILQLLNKFNTQIDSKELIDVEKLKSRTGKKLFQNLVLDSNKVLMKIFNDESFKQYISINEYEGKKYFNKERLEEVLETVNLFFIFNYRRTLKNNMESKTEISKELVRVLKKIKLINKYINKQAAEYNYLFDEFVKSLGIT